MIIKMHGMYVKITWKNKKSFSFVFHDTVHFVSKFNCSQLEGYLGLWMLEGSPSRTESSYYFFLRRIMFGRRTVPPAVTITVTVIRVALRLD